MKRRRLLSCSTERQPDRDIKTDDLPEDCVSQLPPEILVSIFSRLNLKEAARTSLVSRRWRYLWTYSANLVFDAQLLWSMYGLGKRNMYEEKGKYLRWVDEVLKLHRGPYIEEFKIHLNLGDNEKGYITKWIYAALAKGVQKLELRFGGGYLGYIRQPYSFPLECYNYLKTPNGLSGIRFLRSLSLENVQVTQEIVEFFICNCRYLERLCVDWSRTLSSLKIVGSSVRLKHLEIHSCNNLKEITISAPSLVSFKYYGRLIKLQVENVPLLLDLSLRIYGVPLRNCLDPVISLLPQLEILELKLVLTKDVMQSLPFELPKLWHLTIDVVVNHGGNLSELTQMITACPSLNKFTLKSRDVTRNQSEIIGRFPGFSHRHLRVMEFIGSIWHPVIIEFAWHLCKNATMLEKVIINPTEPLFLGTYLDSEDDEYIEVTRKGAAEQLKRILPQGVELVVY